MNHGDMLVRWDELALDKVTEMVARKSVSGLRRTLTQMYLKKGAIIARHVHAEETMIYVLQGALRAQVAGQDVTAREGDTIVVPAGAPHQAEILDDTFVLTVK